MSAEMGDNSNIDIDYEDLEQILINLADKAKSVSEANGSLRTAIKGVLDEHGWHKKALGDIRAIERMSETSRADYLRTFEPMFDAMMEHKWRAEQENLLDELEREAD